MSDKTQPAPRAEGNAEDSERHFRQAIEVRLAYPTVGDAPRNLLGTGLADTLSANVSSSLTARYAARSMGANLSNIDRPTGMFVVRNSDGWDKILFNAMRDRPYQPHRRVPAIATVGRAGMAPPTGPYAAAGNKMLSELTLNAAIERDAIVARLLPGRRSKWRGNERVVVFPLEYMFYARKRLLPGKSNRRKLDEGSNDE